MPGRRPARSAPACAPRGRGCRARIRRQAHPCSRVRSRLETLLDLEQAAPQRSPEQIDRHVELGRELFAAESAVIGEQQHALAVWFEPSDAGEQPFKIVGQLMAGHAAGALVLIDDFRLAVAGSRLRSPRHIDGQAPGDRDHPGERRRLGRIELASVAPDLQIGLLHDVGGEVVAAQNSQHHAIELGAGRPIEPLERNRVILGDGREQPCDFKRRRHDSKNYFLLGSPFKLAQAAQPRCIAGSRRRAKRVKRTGWSEFAVTGEDRPKRPLWPPTPPSVENRQHESPGPAAAAESPTEARSIGSTLTSPGSTGLRHYALALLRIMPTASSSACSSTSSSARSRIWSRSPSNSTFFISSKASPRAALASSSWTLRSSAERLRLSRRCIAALA